MCSRVWDWRGGRHRLAALVETLNALAERHDMPVILSTHPRTRKRLDAFGITFAPRVQDLKPFGFHDYNHLQMNAFCAISDSVRFWMFDVSKPWRSSAR